MKGVCPELTNCPGVGISFHLKEPSYGIQQGHPGVSGAAFRLRQDGFALSANRQRCLKHAADQLGEDEGSPNSRHARH